ncbi:MAG: universal stress protein [Nitrososphaerota archaeon]|nr:universal stress protein [Nitrososphaerota archaeon]
MVVALVCYDGTEGSDRALSYAVEALRGKITELHLAYVAQSPGDIPEPVPAELLESIRAEGREILSEAKSAADSGSMAVATHLEMGNPGETLLRLADGLRPDVVVMGVARHTAAEKALGTVSSSFLKARRHRLLIVP